MKAAQESFIGGWEVWSCHLSKGQERCKVGQAKEPSTGAPDFECSSLLPESLTLGNPLGRTGSGSGFVNYQ